MSGRSEMKNRSQRLKAVYTQPAFLICTLVLAIAGSGMSIAVKSFGVYLQKEPLPLKKSLNLLDEMDLAPYKVVSKSDIENQEVVKTLGTEDYIQWYLEDADAADDSPVRYCSLFITYYGLPDIVPHVPDECYMGSGYQRLASDSVTFEIDRAAARQKIPGRCIIFANANSKRWQPGKKFPVLYFFRVNGVYVSSREDARFTLNKNIRGRHSYFSKVEWKFYNTRFGAAVYPGRDEAVAASQKLLSVILPVLESRHWPDWQAEEPPGGN